MVMKIKAVCPECDYVVDDASSVDAPENHQPDEGSIGICIRCACLAVYYVQEGQTLGLRLPTDEERAECDADERITKVRAAIVAHEVWMKK